jgi:sugar phosphate isomerase/epimerase
MTLNYLAATISLLPVKFTVSTLCCPDWPLDRIATVLSDNKIEGVDFRGLGEEIDITKLPAFTDDLDKTLTLLTDAKLSVPCFCTSVTLLSPSPDRWDAMLEEFHRYAKLAAKTKTPFIRVFGGKAAKGVDEKDALLIARRRLHQLVKISKPGNCKPLVETHDDWSTAARALQLVQEMPPVDVGVLWDVEHPFRHGETPHQTVALLGKYLAHVHLKDSVRVGDRNIPKLLGHGELPLDDCLTALKQSGYSAWLCQETEKRWHTDAPEPWESIPQFADFLRARLRNSQPGTTPLPGMI